MELTFVVISILVGHGLSQALANTNVCNDVSFKGSKPKNIVVIVADDLGGLPILYVCLHIAS